MKKTAKQNAKELGLFFGLICLGAIMGVGFVTGLLIGPLVSGFQAGLERFNDLFAGWEKRLRAIRIEKAITSFETRNDKP